MRLLTEKDARRLLAAADRIAGLVEPLQQRVAALEAVAGQPAQSAAPVVAADTGALETRIARLEKVIAAIAAAGAQ